MNQPFLLLQNSGSIGGSAQQNLKRSRKCNVCNEDGHDSRNCHLALGPGNLGDVKQCTTENKSINIPCIYFNRFCSWNLQLWLTQSLLLRLSQKQLNDLEFQKEKRPSTMLNAYMAAIVRDIFVTMATRIHRRK